MRACQVGFDVVGIEIDRTRVGSLQAGASYVEDVSDEELQKALASGRYEPTSDTSRMQGFDAAVITVPTPLKDAVPDLTFIEDAARGLGPYITPGATVVLESTTYPGTTEELMVPILESESGLKAGRDFFVGYSPERIDPGNRTWNFVNTPKVAAGIDATSARAVVGLYSRLVDNVVEVGSPREAELTKLLENTFRHVNIALVNELAVFAHELGIDVWQAIEAASTKPFGFMPFTPGPGVGGHCLPVDPSYLSWQVRKSLGHDFRFVGLANDVNDHMPDYVVQRVTDGLNATCKSIRGSQILLVGLAYKKNTGDARESPSLRVARLLAERGAILTAADPFIEPHRVPDNVTMVDLNDNAVSGLDAIIILTDHDVFDFDLLAASPAFTLDTRHRLSRGCEYL
jgi:UDP-N-acetyl-D-glucosamine dehydrogenase